jgi:transforming growth factor-beta-induced protein
MRNTRTRFAAIGLVITMALVGAACGDDDDSSADSGSSNDTTETTEKMMSDTTMAESTATEPTGPGCAAVPADGAGSFAGMATDPAATAASNNPALSTLVAAVQAAGLVDTLNGTGPFTIFAPTNDAFAKIPADTLNAVLADKDQLTKILTYHVVSGEMDGAALVDAGTATTVEGGDLTVTASGDTVKVNDATVVCANIPTANATVHLIDTVLMPPA